MRPCAKGQGKIVVSFLPRQLKKLVYFTSWGITSLLWTSARAPVTQHSHSQGPRVGHISSSLKWKHAKEGLDKKVGF